MTRVGNLYFTKNAAGGYDLRTLDGNVISNHPNARAANQAGIDHVKANLMKGK